MGKIGNEARLVLYLAKSRVDGSTPRMTLQELQFHPLWNDDAKDAFRMGVRIGTEHYENALNLIVIELENAK